MNNEKIELLKGFIKKIKNLDTVELTFDTELATLELDSLDIVELQMMYEDTTDKTTLDPVKPILTVKDILELMP